MGPEYAMQNSAGQNPRAIATLSPPSLEERLQHLQRACERLMKLRSTVAAIANRISLDGPETGSSGNARPEPSQLSERFGDAINIVHDACDDLERTTTRLENLLFACNQSNLKDARR